MVVSPWAVLLQNRICRPNPSGQVVAVNLEFFTECLRPMLVAIRFDEEWYLQKYPDVREAVLNRVLPNAHEHYLRYGFFENRLPYRIPVDEAWYLEQHSDIRIALQNNAISSAQAHFEQVGFAEGRMPFPDFELGAQA